MQRETTRRVEQFTAAIRAEVAARRFLRLLQDYAEQKAGFYPSQPRVPAGNREGGQWVGLRGGDHIPYPTVRLLLAAGITGFTKHGINRAIQRSVSPAVILDAVTNPMSIEVQPNGSTQYIGAGAMSY